MNVFDKARVIVYRYHEKSLEVFMIEPKAEADQTVWKFPLASALKGDAEMIELDSVEEIDGRAINTIALEGDWHNIPSIRGLLRHDVKRATLKIQKVLPEIEKGTFISLKEAFKKVLPKEYEALKELKEVLMEKATIRNI